MPFVTEFGLARRIEGDSKLTQSGAIVGTPSYIAPEQAAGQAGLTTAVDVYALGAILYECLTGRPPLRAESPLETLRLVLEQEPERPRTLNPACDRDLETICLKCLEKEPARRYESEAALADDLEPWLAGEPIRARPGGGVRGRSDRPCRRGGGPGAAVGLAARGGRGQVVAAAALCVAWRQGEELLHGLSPLPWAAIPEYRPRAWARVRQTAKARPRWEGIGSPGASPCKPSPAGLK